MDNNEQQSIFAEERKQMIVDIINKKGKITVDAICEMFNVSPATARNDLRALGESGLVKRTHGGAISSYSVSYEPLFEHKAIENKESKAKIGKMAASFIEDGNSIIIDTGTTTLEMVYYLQSFKNLIVLTNDLMIASYLESNSECSVIMLGGEVRKKYHYVVGNFAENMVNQIKVDKAFIGVNGLSVDGGLSITGMASLGIKRKFIDVANEVIVLCDSSKIGIDKFAKLADLSETDRIITDSEVPQEFVEEAKEKDVEVHIV